MPTRQAKHLQQQSVVRLRTRAEALPLAIGYDQERCKYTVCWTDDPDTELIAARHEVVAAYIDGFARAWINRPLPPTVPEPSNVRQTACRHCGQDIENFAPYRKGEWRDRGGNTHCPTPAGDAGQLHQPVID